MQSNYRRSPHYPLASALLNFGFSENPAIQSEAFPTNGSSPASDMDDAHLALQLTLHNHEVGHERLVKADPVGTVSFSVLDRAAPAWGSRSTKS
jgi:hypothetical protein